MASLQDKFTVSAAGLLLGMVITGESVHAGAAEVCRFAGATDYAGHVAITTNVATGGGVTRVDVASRFDGIQMFLFHIHYMVEEISTWRGGEMQSVALNTRYLVGDQIVRQQWDTFERGKDGLQARRVQGKTLADFRLRHPGFVSHWDPATFGSPWLQDYRAASSERRADLDLKASLVPPGLRTPLAMAFYWVRWLPHGGADVPVFLPGFKTDQLVKVPLAAVPSGTGLLWHAPLRYASFNKRPASTAMFWTSADGHLLQLGFEVHEERGSAAGLIHQEGCEGTAGD